MKKFIYNIKWIHEYIFHNPERKNLNKKAFIKRIYYYFFFFFCEKIQALPKLTFENDFSQRVNIRILLKPLEQKINIHVFDIFLFCFLPTKMCNFEIC